MKKSTDRTVFVRFTPPSASIRRHHLEELFSQVGPIKKSSVILPPVGNTNREGEQQKSSPTATVPPAVASSYGFIKYTRPEDAKLAEAKFHGARLAVSPHEHVTVYVERASNAFADAADRGRRQPHHHSADAKDPTNINDDEPSSVLTSAKKKNRLILRNLAFKATENDIRKVLESRFGPLIEVHLPRVPEVAPGGQDEQDGDTNDKKKKSSPLRHRGFAFVTFANHRDAQVCLQQCSEVAERGNGEKLEIRGRQVRVDATMDKTHYEEQKQQQSNGSRKPAATNIMPAEDFERRELDDEVMDPERNDAEGDADNTSEDIYSEDEHGDHGSCADSSKVANENGTDSVGGDEHAVENSKTSSEQRKNDAAIAEKRTLFLRNLPFDATRHEVFELMRKFGRIESIFMVKDRRTGLFQGTAFCTFEKPQFAARVLNQKASSSDDDPGNRTATKPTETPQEEDPIATTLARGLLQLKGRNLLIDYAVDKETAETLASEKHEEKRGRQHQGSDRRNIYLKSEGRVEDNDNTNNTWQDLPESDQLKRQRAWSDKNSKLQSPLFFVNPKRLSVRNLAKHVDEAALKKLCVEATNRGLQRKLVAPQDQIAHYKAVGEMTTREILSKIQCGVDDTSATDAFLPAFDDKNVKKYIPSVYIDRDYDRKNKNSDAPSRGFGFVEFAHHVHALACLRELNNNFFYTEGYVAGGKQAMQLRKHQQKKHYKKRSKNSVAEKGGSAKLPRLIVEFTVENKAKAKEQAEHRAQQEANRLKQKREYREEMKIKANDALTKQKKRKGRGALQRERRRKQRLEEANDSSPKEPNGSVASESSRQTGATKDDCTRIDSNIELIRIPANMKKRKIDQEKTKFTELVESYKMSFAAVAGVNEAKLDGSATAKGDNLDGVKDRKKRRRWFD